MKRDSSPPLAIRVSGANGAPGLVETSNSTRSLPRAAPLRLGAAARSRCGSGRRRASAAPARPRRRGRAARRRRARAARQPRRRLLIGGARRARRRAPARRGPRSPASIAASRARSRRRAPASSSGSTRCLRASARRSRTAAPRPPRAAPGRRPAPRRRAASASSASRASISARSSAASASASSACSAAIRSSRRAAWRSCGKPAVRAVEQVRRPRRCRRRAARPSACRRAASASASSSPGSGASAASSATACSSHSRSRAAASSLARAAASAASASRQARQRALAPAAVSIRPNASSRARWPRGLSRPRSSCWPWISTSIAPSSRSSAGRRRLVVDEGAAAAVGLDDAADDQRLAGLAVEPVLGEQGAAPDGRAARSKLAVTTACACAVPDQPAVGAGAERQAERIEQDRLARAGLAGQHAEARAEFELERARSARRRGWRARSASTGLCHRANCLRSSVRRGRGRRWRRLVAGGCCCISA